MAQHALPERFLLDVTIRDGGYLNGHSWTWEDALAVVRAVGAAGVPYTEVGYATGGPHDRARPAASCPPDYLDELAAAAPDTGLVVMVKPDRISLPDVAALARHGVRMVRFPVPATNVGKARAHVDAVRSAGMAASLNIVRISEQTPSTLTACASECERAGADIVYLADSNGSLFPDAVASAVTAVREHVGIPVGFHAHDNIRLAFINSVAALGAGASAIDGSAFGIGKGGGNLRIELAAAHLSTRLGMPLRIEPLLALGAVVGDERRILEDGIDDALVSGLLDVNLDDMSDFHAARARLGVDALLGGALRQRVPGNSAVPA